MKVKKISFLILTLCFSILSCKRGVPKEVVESYRSENILFEKGASDMVISKEVNIREIEDNYNSFLKEIDPKKRKEFDKDQFLLTTIKNKMDCFYESIDKAVTISDSLRAALNTNNLFIESLLNSNLSEKDAEVQWAINKAAFHLYESELELQSKDILEYKSQLYELQKNALLKYGVQAVPVKKKNKR